MTTTEDALPKPQSLHTLYGRECTVCAHVDLGDIDAALVASVPIARLVQQFGVSRDSLYRHLRFHLRPAIQATLASTPSTRPLALVERLAEIADDARAARATAYATGNAALGARLGDAETRALEVLAARFRIDHDTLAADRTKVSRLAKALDVALEASPALGHLMADALAAEGLSEMADDLRNSLSESTPPLEA
ncbi:hypothetical protein M3672_15220 [Microbacterium enclense]|uniref:hypothetical protein n=1 Tax=Microbacterium enclense TaxID=993073 RepID=UPI00203D8813|nr:hypothetical protein [Microbacterium enclense]MCM3615782.1 hypothetical protein [Microbacterium enclense]